MLIPYYILILSWHIISFVNGHGRLIVPISRSEFCTSPTTPARTIPCDDRNWQYCGFVTNQYYYRGN